MDEAERMQVERETMIRCVLMICKRARDYVERMESVLGDVDAKASAFDIESAAVPICDVLGMKLPDVKRQFGPWLEVDDPHLFQLDRLQRLLRLGREAGFNRGIDTIEREEAGVWLKFSRACYALDEHRQQ